MIDMHPSRARWIRRSAIPERFLGSTLDSLSPYAMHESVMSTVRSWIESVVAGEVVKSPGSRACGLGLVLSGSPGAGKSRLAATILQEVAIRATKETWSSMALPTMPIRFSSYADILTDMSSSFDGNAESKYLVDRMLGSAAVPEDVIRILVVDDLGKEHRSQSGWSQSTFERLLRTRFDRGLPTIVTTNVHRDLWAEAYGPSLDSFACEALESLVVISAAGDRRR